MMDYLPRIVFLIFLFCLFTVPSTVVLAPSTAEAGWMDKARSKVGGTVNRTRNATRNTVNRARNATRNTVKRTRNATRNTVNRARNATRNTVKRTQNKFSSARKIGRQKVVNAIEKSNHLTSHARQVARSSAQRLGRKGGQVVAEYLEKTRSKGVDVVKKSIPLLAKIRKRVADPKIRRRMLAATLVAAGTGIAIYQNRDDIKYIALRNGMQAVHVQVNGETKSAEDIYRDAVLARAPYLAGTTIADDPAAMMAYGVTATVKHDLMNNVRIVPDGRGGVTSVNGAVGGATGAEGGLAALQVGASLEGMAIETANSGQLGPNARTFAAAYSNANDKIDMAKLR